MFKRYDKLADHMVNVHETFSDKSDAIAMLKSRTRKFNLQAFATERDLAKN